VKIDRDALQAAVRRACELDVEALKPGNISVDSPAYGMTAADFIVSANAMAEPITRPGLGVGERIYYSIAATQRVVNCNTNLGIVLLLAPIIMAAEFATDNGAPFEQNLTDVLNRLTLADADWAYRAIRLAKPGGLGRIPDHDIADAPKLTLLQAMREAAERDQIAQLYTTGYNALLYEALPIWRKAYRNWGSDHWAMTAVFLNRLATTPDSLIARKFGVEASAAVTTAARPLWLSMESARDPEIMRAPLMAWDVDLKEKKLNPGTTADVSVATVFYVSLQDGY
jgi:triphosphoribosyl-dephospho-CoA synthase